jgi:hypothetical protein
MAFATITESPFICEKHMGDAVAEPGNQTKGVKFSLLGPCKIPGADIYTPIVGIHELKLTLWRPLAGESGYLELAASKLFTLTGPGKFRLLFDSVYDVTAQVLCDGLSESLKNNTAFYMGLYVTSGTHYIMSMVKPVSVDPPQSELLLCGCNEAMKGGGDSAPTMSDWSSVPLSPLIVVEDSTYLPTTMVDYCGIRNPTFQARTHANPITIGYFLRVMRPIIIHGFKFATAIPGPHTVKLRFGVCQGYYHGKKLIERSVLCPGVGEYTEVLPTPVSYDMPAIVNDLEEVVEEWHLHEFRFYKSQYVSMFVNDVRASGVDTAPLQLASGSYNSFHREIITDFQERYRWGDAEWLGMGDGGIYLNVPLSLLVERLER